MGMNPYWIYTQEALGRHKKQNDKYMSFEMNMLIIYHVHYLGTEMEVKKPTNVPQSTPKILTKLLQNLIIGCQI